MTITGHWAVSLWDVYGIGENGASLTCHESLGRVHYWCDLLFCAINIMIIINNYNIYSCLIYYYYVNTCTVHYIYYIYINGLHQPRALDMFNECQDPPKKSLSPRGHGYKSPEKMCKIHPMTGWWVGT
jgi:hypothetical protein